MSEVETRERPILFSGPMIRAILAGTKTMTRRVVKPQFGTTWGQGTPKGNQFFRSNYPAQTWRDTYAVHVDLEDKNGNWLWLWCPYGKPGDKLWIRETWKAVERKSDMVDGILFKADSEFVIIENTEQAGENWVVARDNGKHGDGWRPSIFMPRWASRITLKITEVRVERLQDITTPDIRAEGISCTEHDFNSGFCTSKCEYLRNDWATGWNNINGKRKGCSWADNPWVWVLSFRRVKDETGG